jgi:hypothetical protein
MGIFSDLSSALVLLIATLWALAFIAYLGGAPGEFVVAAFLGGLVTGSLQLWVTNK